MQNNSGVSVEEKMSDGLAIDFAKVLQDHILWVGAVLLLVRLL